MIRRPAAAARTREAVRPAASRATAATNTPPDPGETGIVLPLMGVLLVLACVVGFGLETRRLWRSGVDAEA